MKTNRTVLYVILLLALSGTPVFAAEMTTQEEKCASGTVQDSSGICGEPGNNLLQLKSEGSGFLQTPLEQKRKGPDVLSQNATTNGTKQPESDTKTFVIYFFWGKGCPHCEKEKQFLNELKKDFPTMQVKDYEVWYNKRNAVLLSTMLNAYDMQVSGVPITFVDRNAFAGFSRQSRQAIEAAIGQCRLTQCVDPGEVLRSKTAGEAKAPPSVPAVPTAGSATAGKGTTVDIPLIGTLDARDTSLPVMTLVIAGLDSFNPCAFFVLLSLLGLLVHAQSRGKMMLIGGVFVFFSGFIYFLFMAAWLNLFLVMGQVAVITAIAGGVSVIMAGINIKDFFIFKQGLSLTIPDNAKPRLFDRMRRLMRATSLISVLVGTTVLAIVANSYELLCTAGFPMVFTRILTLQRLSSESYYLYLVFYNIVYVVPLLIIVLLFTRMLGSRKLTEWQGRVLKLVSGAMMLGLGGVLLVNPALLNSVTISFAILAGALGVSLLVATLTKRLGY